MTSAAAGTATAQAIEHDLTCGGCDYNLRGLPRNGACPECGHDVAATLQGFSRTRAAWLRRVSRGSLLIGIGILVGGVGLGAIAAWAKLLRWIRVLFGSAGVAAMTELRGWFLLCSFASGAIIAAIGTWIFATPARGRGNGWSDHLLRILLRLLGLGTCVLQLYITASLAEAYGLAPHLVSYPQNFARVLEITAVVWAGAAAMTCLRAAMLAGRVNDRPGRVQAVLIGILATAAPVWGAMYWNTFDQFRRIAYFVAIGVAAGWSIVFFIGFAFVLRRRATRMADRARGPAEFSVSGRGHRLQ